MRIAGVLLTVALLAPQLPAADAPPTPNYDIPRLDRITIDGDASDWKEDGFRIDVLAPGDGKIVPPSDFDALVRVAQGEQVLLVLVSVADDELRGAGLDGTELSSGDSVEFHVSPRENVLHRLVVAPGVDATGVGTPRVSSSFLGRTGTNVTTAGMRVASVRTPSGYVLEASIPAEALGEDGHFTVVINDADARRPLRRHAPLWMPQPNGLVSARPLRLRPAKAASPALTTAFSIIPAVGEGFARVAIVVAASAAAGQRLELGHGPPALKLDLGGNKTEPPIATERIGRVADRWGAAFTVPLPPLGTTPRPLNVYLDSTKIFDVILPGNDKERIAGLAQFDLRFTPAVFTGDAFPTCDFAAPAAVRNLIGPYTIKPTFFDSRHQPVDRPGPPGRYGALVEIATESGVRLPSRLVTLFKQSAPADWADGQLDARLPALPPQLGVDPRVVAEQQAVLGEHARWMLTDALMAELDTPLLFAALAETRPGDPPLAGRNSIWARNERWWYPLKQKLARTRYAYLADLPANYNVDRDPPLAVLLFLHGSGDRGSNLSAVRTHGPPKLVKAGKSLPFLVISPQCPAGESWSAPQLKDLLDEVSTKYRIDPERIYLTGLSMGGYGVWELAAEYPDRFAAIAPICGAGSPADADRLKNLPAWVFHGQKDREVPIARSTEMVDALKKAGGRVKFTPYPDLGHDSWTPTYDNPDLYTWLLKQKRNAPSELPHAPQ